MRPALRAFWLGGAVALAACGQATQPGTGGLNGTNTVAVVRVAGLYDGGVVVDALFGQLAFVTSARTNSLKAVNLFITDPSQVRDYVPAPNPLEALSIPVVDEPVELAAAVRYGPIATSLPEFPGGILDGQERTGMLLFVRGSGSPFISVVGAANVPQSLKQLKGGLLQQSAGPVTAITARLTSSEQNVVLYYATFDGQDATVWERVLQHPVTTDPNFRQFPTSLYPVNNCLTPPAAPTESSLYLCPPRPVRTYRNASVSALQALPTQGARQPGDPPTGSIDTPLPVLCQTPNPSGVGCASGGLEGGRLAVALRELVPPSNNPLVLSNAGEVRIIDPALPAEADASETSTDPLFRITRFFPNGPPDEPYIVEPPIIPNAPAQPPVRQLLTHSRTYLTSGVTDAGLLPDAGVPLPVLAYEGSRLFGVLDESSCFGAQTCTGILAVDADPRLPDAGDNSNYGLLSFDDSDCLRDVPGGGQTCIFEVGDTNRMLALRLGRGIVQGVAVAAEATFPTPVGLGLVPLLGIATVSGIGDGTAQIFFFDALGLRFINETVGAGIVGSGVSLVVPTVGTSIIDAGPSGLVPITIGVGLYPDSESINIVNQALIPTLGLVDGLPDAGLLPDGTFGLIWPVDGGALAAANVVEVGDNLLPVNLSGTYCQVGLIDGGSLFQCQDADPSLACVTVRGVGDGGGAIFTDPMDLSLCPGVSGYSVQTGHASALPFLVVGSVNGVIGRMTAGSGDGGAPLFVVPNPITVGIGKTYPRFYNPDVDAGVRIVDNLIIPPGAVADAGTVVLPLTMQLPGVDTVFFFNQGAYYTFTVASGFLRASLPLDTSSLGFQALYLPGGVAATRVRDVNGEFVLVLIAYPSGNAVIDFIPDLIIPNNPNAGAITVHF
jgi:hypothetical protein